MDDAERVADAARQTGERRRRWADEDADSAARAAEGESDGLQTRIARGSERSAELANESGNLLGRSGASEPPQLPESDRDRTARRRDEAEIERELGPE